MGTSSMGNTAGKESSVCSSNKSNGRTYSSLKELGSKLFLSNKYSNCYWKIIERSKDRIILLKTERHHILPKGLHLFPEFKSFHENPWNLAKLTLREHFICHRLLIKMTYGKAKMSCAYALKRLTSTNKNSHEYEIAKKILIKLYKEFGGPAKGHIHSEESKRKISDSNKGRICSNQVRKNMSIAATGKKLSDKTK